jgi:diguanylate cyclase (GGDEF)-like protein/PAS domain S-box-containing protein
MRVDLIRVLIADADQDRVLALRALLDAERGVRFEVASHGRIEPALAALSESRFDVVLADLTLEDSEGLPTLALLLTYAGSAPVIVLSESADDPTPLRALQQGAHDHIPRDQLYGMPVIRAIRYAVERSRSEAALRESRERYRMLFQQSRDAVFITDREWRIVEVNRAALELLGYRAEELVGRDLRLHFGDPSEFDGLARELEREGSVREVELLLVGREGRERYCLVAAAERRSPAGPLLGWQGIIHDITERKRAERQLEHAALHDALTELPNRALFMDRLEQAVQRYRRTDGRTFAILLVDLDRLKSVNDLLGHGAGDEVLRRAAGLLRGCVRSHDTVARLGGDEFVVLVNGVRSLADVIQVAERMLERLNRPYRLGGREYFTTASMGITCGRKSQLTPAALLREADLAMYRAKARGGASYQLFDAAMSPAGVSQLELESDLRQALRKEQLVLHYQPILRFDTGRTTGFEALVRWNHPERGLLLPESFIPMAEETGLIVPLGEWTLRQAARQLREWREEIPAGRDVVMSINLSPRQFVEAHLVDRIRTLLDEERIPTTRIRLELTETALMHDPAQAGQKLKELGDAGIGLCLDDFGTGYSSLSYLRNLPLQILKIDRSFVGRIEQSRPDMELVATMSALARNLGIQAIVEGVETPGQLARLRQVRPHEVQGFLFSRAVEPERASAFLGATASELAPRRGCIVDRMARRLGLRESA